MATHSSTFAWRIPWTEEPGRLQSTGSQRVGHDFTFTFTLTGPKMARYLFKLISGCVCEGVSESDLHLNWWMG